LNSPHKRRRRRPVHALLHKKHRRVKSQSHAIAEQLQQAIKSGDRASSAAEVAKLRKTLQGLREEVMRDGAGKHTKQVAAALHDMDHSLALLSKANGSTDPNAALNELAKSKHALDAAHHKAKAAGHDWSL
jgi:hypothetical protein